MKKATTLGFVLALAIGASAQSAIHVGPSAIGKKATNSTVNVPPVAVPGPVHSTAPEPGRAVKPQAEGRKPDSALPHLNRPGSDHRLDARTLAGRARIDPQLLVLVIARPPYARLLRGKS